MQRLSRYRTSLRFYSRAGIGLIVLMTLGRLYRFRRLMKALYSLQRRNSPPAMEAHTICRVPAELQNAVETLREDGVFAGIHLEESAHREMIDFLERHVCYGNGLLNYPFRYSEKANAEREYERRFTLARYYYIHRDCDAIRKLAADPLLVNMAQQYLGAGCVFLGARAWWSFACGSSEVERIADGQAFHYDLDDYGALSFFFYLTDTGPSAGPHECVRGSHRRKPLRFTLSPSRVRTEGEITRCYGLDNLLVLIGAAGFGFAEDTACYHRGAHPESGDRLIVQLRYAIHDYGGASDEASILWNQDLEPMAKAVAAGAIS
jgi:hypothetical protein